MNRNFQESILSLPATATAPPNLSVCAVRSLALLQSQDEQAKAFKAIQGD